MFSNNLKYGLRNLLRDKFYSAINLLGLSIGMAAALLIFFWVSDELSFDNFHPKGDQIYRVLGGWENPTNRNLNETTPYHLAEAAKENIPEVEAATIFVDLWSYTIKYNGKISEFENGYLVPNDFWGMFNFPLLEGNSATVFTDPNGVVITEAMAIEIFGDEEPMGKIVNLNSVMDVKVTGILQNPPTNSHLQFTSLLTLKPNIDKFSDERNRHWGNFSYYTYLQLQPDADLQKVEAGLTAQLPEEQVKRSAEYDARSFFELQPFSDIYLHSEMLEWSSMPKGDLKTIRIVGFIGLLILLIACINYVNLSTARAAIRAKNTGVRKIIGATRIQLFQQFLTETAILVIFATILAVMLTQICLPAFADFSGKNFTTAQLYSWQTLFIVGLTVLGTIILTGIQPALQLSAFKPIQVLQNQTFSGIGGKGGLRKILVVSQFAISAALIMATIVVLNQLNFVRKAKLGFEKEHIFTVLVGNEKLPIFLTELKKNPAIIEVTASDHLIYDVAMMIGGTKWEGKTDELPWQSWSFSATDNFKDFYDLQLADGRWFQSNKADSTSFLINETAAISMNLENPVGKWMEFNDVKGHIIGVVKDFHFRSMHEAIEPLILTNFNDRFFRIQVKTTGENASKAIAATEKLYQEQLPDSYFKYSFVDEAYDKLYTSEAKTGKLFALFAGLAILLSCLGIFGLAAFTAQRRTKEIGIRKVLGASFNNLVLLLCKDFLVLVVIALFIAIPLAWYAMNDWLNNFAYHISMEWWVFGLTGLALGVLAFLTVSYQSVRAALVNPVESLRSE